MDSELSRVPTKLIQIYTVQLAVSSHYITTSWHLTELFKTAKHLKKKQLENQFQNLTTSADTCIFSWSVY